MLESYNLMKLSDFGLASWTSPSIPHIIGSDVSGTFGYVSSSCKKYQVDYKSSPLALRFICAYFFQGLSSVSYSTLYTP